MAQQPPPDATDRKRRTLEEIRAEIDRLYSSPLDDDPWSKTHDGAAGRPVRTRIRRRLVAGGVTAVIGAVAISAMLADTRPARPGPGRESKAAATVAPEPPRSPAPSEHRPAAPEVARVSASAGPAGDEGVLRHALDAWLAATNQRDLPRVLAFYPERVPRFYLAHDVPREAIAADKARQFGQVEMLEIRRTGDVALTIDPAGDVAVMRFTKRYVITGPRVNRQGESLHELRWAKREAGWTIVSERDLRVLR